MRLQVMHTTRYVFPSPMRALVQSLRLRPSRFDGQRVVDWQVEVSGAGHGAAFRDGAGDWIETVSLRGPVEEVTISVTGEVETTDLAGVLRGHREQVPPMVYLRGTRATEADVALADLARGAGTGEPLELAHRLAAAVAGAIDYLPGETDAATTAAEALAQGRGVCQDHAHALIAVARAAGLPGRYVVGYLMAEGAIAEASHAWAEIHVRGLGWVGFDPANRCCPDERYIRIGSGFDATDAAPIRGVALGRGPEQLHVAVAVRQAAQ